MTTKALTNDPSAATLAERSLDMHRQLHGKIEVRSRVTISSAEDLALAFSYIDNVGIRTRTEIHSILGDGLRRSVKDPLSRHMPYTEQSVKEETT